MGSTDITRRITGQAPVPMTASSTSILRRHRAAVVAGEIIPGHALPAGDRQALAARRAELEAALGHRDAGSAAGHVAWLLGLFPSVRAAADDPEAVLAAYVQVLADQPPWAVGEACRWWSRGLVTGQSKRYAPTPPELLDAAVEAARPWHEERRAIIDVLDAVPAAVVDPDRRRSLADRMAALAAEMRGTRRPEPPVTAGEVEAANRRFRGDAPVSDELKARLAEARR